MLSNLVKNLIKSLILNTYTQEVVDDWVNNGFSPADEQIIFDYLDNTPAP